MHIAAKNEWEIPLPPTEYMKLVCGPEHDARTFRAVGEGLVGMLQQLGMIGSHIRLLDIGCGCGRVARCLLDKPLRTYVGFDRHSGMIEWCNREIGPYAPRFTFLYCRVKSPYTLMDGDAGVVDVADFRFPFDDRSFDAVLLASVFTHMPMRETAHYLNEIYRVLDQRGTALFSVFFVEGDGDPYDNGVDFVHKRRSFLDMIDATPLDYKFVTESCGHHWFLGTRKDR
jgi:SAM-dependent methyltransferase